MGDQNSIPSSATEFGVWIQGVVFWPAPHEPTLAREFRAETKPSDTKKDTPHLVRSGGCNTLATSYFRRPYRPTIIGATVFHFRVRNGNGWDHCAMITRLGTALRATPESNDRESNSQATAYRIEQILYKPSERTELEMEQCKTNR